MNEEEKSAPQHGALPWPRLDDLDISAREVYDQIAGGPRAAGPKLFSMVTESGQLEGPFNAMLTAPAVGLPLQDLGAAIRYRTSLSHRAREIAILMVAAHHRSDFEWYAHEAVGRANGLTDDELENLKALQLPPTCSSEERAVFELSEQLLAHRHVTTATRESAVSVLGIHGVTETVVLIGYYQTLDLLMQAWEIPLPKGVPAPFNTQDSTNQAGE